MSRRSCLVSSASTLPPTALAGPRRHVREPLIRLEANDGDPQPIVGLEVGVEVRADAEHQGAGCVGGRVESKVDEQARRRREPCPRPS